jgi:hypothetical protein
MSCAAECMFGELSGLSQMRFVVYFLLMSCGMVCAGTCSHGVGVDFEVPVIIRSVVFN